MRKFIKSFCDCEISIELIRQRIHNKSAVRADAAFNAMDKDQKGHLTLDDVRSFLNGQGQFPHEKDIGLFFERFDRDEDQVIGFEEFVTAITPFLQTVDQIL